MIILVLKTVLVRGNLLFCGLNLFASQPFNYTIVCLSSQVIHNMVLCDNMYDVQAHRSEVGSINPVLSCFLLLSARFHNQIRASVFTLIATLAKKLPVFVAANARTLCSLVLGSLSESEPVVAAPLWEAAQLLVTTVEVRT